jgi:hypothetical protein
VRQASGLGFGNGLIDDRASTVVDHDGEHAADRSVANT